MGFDGLVEGRTCGKCHLCCKVMTIAEIDKPRDAWCEHCEIGVGCRIYEQRPDTCRAFHCWYRRDASLDERWNPARAHFLLRAEDDTTLVVQVDSQRPQAWQREPYHAALRRFATAVYPDGRKIFVRAGDRTHLILPDRDIDFGVCGPRDRVVVRPAFTSVGVRWEAEKISG